MKAHRAYARYTATIGVLTLDNTLISRAVVQNEFRAAGDLVDRVGGGAGPGGVKAVAPTGTESITRGDSGSRARRSACWARSSPSNASTVRRPTRSPAARSPSSAT